MAQLYAETEYGFVLVRKDGVKDLPLYRFSYSLAASLVREKAKSYLKISWTNLHKDYKVIRVQRTTVYHSIEA